MDLQIYAINFTFSDLTFELAEIQLTFVVGTS